ncbi:MAG TPA: hypothetical protein VFR24_09905 [Candidatus Angelobacter sp.]|nr:hypothetical protein [Candidatus Angelobacter sp.]
MPENVGHGFHFLLEILARKSTRMLNKSLEPKNVPPRLYEVMTFINGAPQNQITISEKLQINKNVMVNLIDELEKRGYCVRVQRTDMRRREYNIELTPKGSKALRDCGKLVRLAERELLAELTDQERTELCRLLEKSLSAELDRQGIL